MKTHLTVSQSTSPAMDCRWWLKWTIVNWLLMRRGIKKISLSSWSLSFSCPSASLFVFTVSSYHLLMLFSFHLVGLWDFLGFGFTSPPLPRWDVSPLQVTPQHFIRFPWQQYPYIILGGENPVKVKCLTQEHNTATCPSLELRALDIYPSLPNISIHILPTAL